MIGHQSWSLLPHATLRWNMPSILSDRTISCPRSLGFEPIAELVMLDQRHVVRFGETEHTPSLIVQSLLMVLYPSEALQNPYQFPINHIWNRYIYIILHISHITPYYTIPVKSVNSHNPIDWIILINSPPSNWNLSRPVLLHAAQGVCCCGLPLPGPRSYLLVIKGNHGEIPPSPINGCLSEEIIEVNGESMGTIDCHVWLPRRYTDVHRSESCGESVR